MLTDEQRNELKTLILEYGIASVMESSESRPRQINRIIDFVSGIAASAAPAEGRETAYQVSAGGKWVSVTQAQYDAWSGAKRIATAPTMSEAARRVIDAARRMLGRGDTVVSPCFGDRAFISSASDVEALSNALSEFDFAAAKGGSDA